MCQLHADDRVIDEFLSKRLALRRVLDTLLETDAREAQTLDDDPDSFVVEVCHDDLEALVDLTEHVFNRDLDVFECNVGGAAAPDTLTVHSAGADAFSPLNQEQTDATHTRTACPDSRGEIVAPDTVGDPLLFSVDNEVLAVFR